MKDPKRTKKELKIHFVGCMVTTVVIRVMVPIYYVTHTTAGAHILWYSAPHRAVVGGGVINNLLTPYYSATHGAVVGGVVTRFRLQRQRARKHPTKG